jgi:peptide/nickel transport system substrate-binding protein
MRVRLLRVLVPGLIVAFALALSSCGDDDDGGGTSAGDFEAPTSAPDDAQKGGELQIIAAADIDYMDPGAAYYQFSYMVIDGMHRKVMHYEPDSLEPVPDLAAEQPEISSDDRTVTVTIRDDVEFGPPVNRTVEAADVEYALERALMPGVANGYFPTYFSEITGFAEAQQAVEQDKTVAPDIKGITALDETTLEIKLDEPVAGTIVNALSLPVSAPVPEEYAKEFDAESPSTYGDHVVATGPYMVENNADGELTGYTPGKEIRLIRNPNWNADSDFRPAYLDKVTVLEGFTDVDSAMTKILKGDSQVNGDILPTPTALKQAATEFPDQLVLVPSGGNRYISMNTTIPPFDDVNVRKAVVAAADREQLRLARGGELVGPIANHFIPPGVPGFEEAGGLEGPGFDFLESTTGDPDLAAEYMRKAGYESGKYEGNEELLFVGENAGVDKKQSEVARELFESLGFNLDVKLVDGDVMYTDFCQVPDAEVAICPTVGFIKDFNDGLVMVDATFSGENIQPAVNYNYPELDDPAVNKAINDASAIDDPAERAEAFGEVDKMITELAPAVPLIWDDQPNVRSANVNGVITLYNAQWDISYVSLEGGG